MLIAQVARASAGDPDDLLDRLGPPDGPQHVMGDVRRGTVKRVASAVGEGSIAIRLIHEFLALAERP